MNPRAARLVAPAALALLLTACGSDDGDDGDAEVSIGTAAYAFEWLAAEIGGDRVSVENVTPPGADAHSLELAPAQVVDLEQTDLVVHLPQFQTAMDDAVAQLDVRVLDVSVPTEPLAPEELAAQGTHAGHDHGAETASEDDGDDEAHDHGEHDDESHSDDHAGHDHGPLDPHVWLDPDRMIALAGAITTELTEIDPDGAETYAENRDAVVADLESLHEEMDASLTGCAIGTVVVGHEAFGYLLGPHGFTEEGLAGLDGGTEVSPARIAELSALVEETGATAIYRDANAPDDAVRAVAEQTGAEVQVLDPLEIAPSEGDYRDAMQANIDALHAGQQCG
ncbi:MAG: metal ABC transporter solute-binding protein, Zn/Mn family [Actinomycetaceae bacterium]